MSLRDVAQRPAARDDVTDAARWYADQGGEALALRFIESVHTAFAQLARHPVIGSPVYGTLTAHRGLRSWPLKRFPYLVFYLDRGDWLEIWRVLHAERDIPQRLLAED